MNLFAACFYIATCAVRHKEEIRHQLNNNVTFPSAKSDWDLLQGSSGATIIHKLTQSKTKQGGIHVMAITSVRTVVRYIDSCSARRRGN